MSYLLEDTMILLPDGTQKRVDELRIGDEVTVIRFDDPWSGDDYCLAKTKVQGIEVKTCLKGMEVFTIKSLNDDIPRELTDTGDLTILYSSFPDGFYGDNFSPTGAYSPDEDDDRETNLDFGVAKIIGQDESDESELEDEYEIGRSELLSDKQAFYVMTEDIGVDFDTVVANGYVVQTRDREHERNVEFTKQLRHRLEYINVPDTIEFHSSKTIPDWLSAKVETRLKVQLLEASIVPLIDPTVEIEITGEVLEGELLEMQVRQTDGKTTAFIRKKEIKE